MELYILRTELADWQTTTSVHATRAGAERRLLAHVNQTCGYVAAEPLEAALRRLTESGQTAEIIGPLAVID